YNGSTTVALSGTATLSGLMNGNTGTVTGSLTGTVGSANVQEVAGVAQPETVTTDFGFSLTSGDLSDYTFVQPSLTATINPVSVTVSGLSPLNDTYDGSTTVALTGTPVFSGLLGSQTLTIGNLTTGGLAGSANAGSQSVTGEVQLANGTNGGLAGNYSLSVQPALSDVTISPASVTVSGLSPVNYTYDGSTTVALSGTPVFAGLVGSQTLTIDNLTTGGLAGSANAGAQSVTGQLQLANGTNGGLASNYAVSVQPTLSDVTISPASVTVSGLSPVNYTYDGLTTVALSGTPIFAGLVGNQTLTIGNLTMGGVAGSANAGTQPVTGQVQLANGANGGLASNYSLSVQPTLADVTISPALLTVVGSIALPMTYGGSAQVAIVGSHLDGVAPGEEVFLVSDATIDAQAAGAAVPVTFDDSLTGPDAGNYVIAQQPQGVTVSVLPAKQTVVAPVQDGVAAAAVNTANTSSTTISTVAVPLLAVAGGSQSQTSISVINGGVNAPASDMQVNGFWETLPTTNTKQGRVAVVAAR
ncbi:MAG TPA: YDG domain-containing protein, partial [Mycobacterium sp.]|nr:YDG domain-containing protein [Mycobacterium sp.]